MCRQLQFNVNLMFYTEFDFNSVAKINQHGAHLIALTNSKCSCVGKIPSEFYFMP